MSTSQKTSNDLATVSNSAIYAAFLSVKQPLLSKGSTIYRIKGGMSVFYFCLPTASFKTTSIILVNFCAQRCRKHRFRCFFLSFI